MSSRWSIAFLALCACWPAHRARAYDTYDDGSGGHCAGCHGGFRASPYVSLADGVSWGDDLHDVHRIGMLDRDCDTCHLGTGRTPVFLNRSNGGLGMGPISCVGCHGRGQDNSAANPSVSSTGWTGYGAGLRQHHVAAGVPSCAGCHLDASASSYVPVGEEVTPAYYTSGHAGVPVDSCNTSGTESYAGTSIGLDNDGDLAYDMADMDCGVPCADADGDTFSPDGGACGPIDCDDADGATHPAAPEICDGADDDCDGTTDEGCACTPGAIQACETDLGECVAGTQTCGADGAWQPCVGHTGPRLETCNGLDDDCDGAADEGLTRACSTACGAGTEICTAGVWGMCDAPAPGVEMCDGIDDDCDGSIDEDLTRACTTACGAGAELCSSGAWGACDAPAPEPDICDGVDNDCDGSTDEGCDCVVGASRPCGSDLGECVAGTQPCAAGGTWGACAGGVDPLEEICDALDNDCDGDLDESLERACSSACGEGVEACEAGSWRGCTAPGPESETCNGLDDDCDGTADEGCVADGGGADDGSLADGGTPVADAGCSCGVGARRRAAGGALPGLLLALALLARRRERRR